MSSEKDKRSVLTVIHLAWDKLQSGEVDGALELLKTVEEVPGSYSTFYVVEASALLTRKEYEKAYNSAQEALRLTPNSPHARLIVEISSERMEFKGESEPRIDTLTKPPRRTLAALLDPISETEATSLHFNIDRTADELTRERPLVRPIPEPEHIQAAQLPEPEDTPSLVSETLAEIMIRQGKLTDAKKVYIQLSRLHPDRYPHFKTKIEAIDKLLLGTSIAPETTTSETTDNDPVA